MNIVHTVKTYPGNGGVQTYLDLLLPNLQSKNINISVIALGNKSTQTKHNGIDVYTCLSLKIFMHQLNILEPDIIHIHEWPTSLILKKYYQDKAVKIIVHHHSYSFICPGQELFYRKQKLNCSKKFNSFICMINAYTKQCQMSRNPFHIFKSIKQVNNNIHYSDRADYFIANSNYVKKKLLDSNINIKKISTLNCFTDIKQEKTVEPIIGQILFLGRLTECKGLERLFDSLLFLDKDNCKCTLSIAGEGYYKNYLENYAKKIKIENRIKFINWFDGKDRDNLIRESDIVVIPSIWNEPFSIVGIEAMALGKPVVAFDVGGISDWLIDGYNGFLIPPYDIKMMSEKIKFLINDRKVNYKYGINGVKYVDNNFRTEKHINQLITLYMKLLQKNEK